MARSPKGPSQRQLRAGELLRHALSEMFLRGEVHVADLPQNVTVTEVRVSPDLRAASAYCAFLGRPEVRADIKALNRAAPAIRRVLAQKVTLKFVPALTFAEDDSFAEAERMEALLRNVRER